MKKHPLHCQCVDCLMGMTEPEDRETSVPVRPGEIFGFWARIKKSCEAAQENIRRRVTRSAQ